MYIGSKDKKYFMSFLPINYDILIQSIHLSNCTCSIFSPLRLWDGDEETQEVILIFYKVWSLYHPRWTLWPWIIMETMRILLRIFSQSDQTKTRQANVNWSNVLKVREKKLFLYFITVTILLFVAWLMNSFPRNTLVELFRIERLIDLIRP